MYILYYKYILSIFIYYIIYMFVVVFLLWCLIKIFDYKFN